MTEQDLIKILKRFRSYRKPGSALIGFCVCGLFLIFASHYLPSLRKPTPIQLPENLPSPSPELLRELPTAPQLANLPASYSVQDGDSSWRIAEAFYGSPYNYADIELANNLSENQSLNAGQILLIPNVPVRSSTEAASRSASKKLLFHTTTNSDTLWLLAQKYYRDGKKWSVIYSANRKVIKNPNHLGAGLKLLIP